MPRHRTLRDRLYRASASVEAARGHIAPPLIAREDLREAVRALADALEDLATLFHVTHSDELSRPDAPDR